VAVVEVAGDPDNLERFGVVRLHDDGTISAATPHDVSRFSRFRQPWTCEGVARCSTLRSLVAARTAYRRITR